MLSQSKRYLGLELGGSRRTAVVCLDYFPAEGRVYLVDKHAHLHGTKDETADEILLRLVNGLGPDAIGVDAPLTLPPCFACELQECPGLGACPKESVQWMREESARQGWSKSKFPPPYTHRPIDLLMRGRWQSTAPLPIPAEEAMGSGRAPLTARMRYLRPHLQAKSFLEVSPRFALVGIAGWYGLTTRELRRARDLESGAENRFTILNKIATKPEIPGLPYFFLYISDVVALAKDLAAFDALLCAMMALFSDLDFLEAPEFDPSWGRVARPKDLRPPRKREQWEEI